MTTLQVQESFPKRNVHYRRDGETVTFAPSTRPDISVDVTKRACVPCAIGGRDRAAVSLDEVGTPQCGAHEEFAAMSRIDRARVASALASMSPEARARLGALL